MDVPDTITCVDCGEKAFRLTEPPEDGFEPGDIVAYRCRGCNDRWDIVVEDDDGAERFDFRAWLEERNKEKDSQ